MSIQPLPGDVAAQIKSSAVITSLNDAVWGLVQNSLDAGASKINISVDYARGNCSVEDNGLGITRASFQEGGGLGQLHCMFQCMHIMSPILTPLDTSKYPHQAGCHGKHGEFLASLAALSLLSIASHHRDYRTHNSLTLHNSRVVVRNLPAPPEQRVLAFPSGTRVVVRDLFGSMPVRVKRRAVEVERFGSSRDFDQLVQNIVALLLPWPSEIMVTVQDSSTRRTVSLRAAGSVDWSGTYRSTGPDIISRTSSLLTQASLVDDEELKTWVPIGASASGISVKGCVSLRPVATRRVQFISLGIEPLLNEHHSNFLYEEVNRVFDNSSFGVLEEAGLGDDGLPAKTEGFTGKELKPKRGVDRWPMFFLQISLDPAKSEVDVEEFIEGRDKTAGVITNLLQVMVYEFLKKHHFRPRSFNALERLKRPKSNSPTPPSQSHVASGAAPSRSRSVSEARSSPKPADRKQTLLARASKRGPSPKSASGSASPFAGWSRVKSSITRGVERKDGVVAPGPLQQVSLDSPLERIPAPNDSTSKADKPLFDKSGNVIRKPFDDGDEPDASPSPATSSLQQSDAQSDFERSTQRETVVWIDPTTKIKSLIDPRTGFAVKSRSSSVTKPISRPTSKERRKHVPQLGEWELPQPSSRNAVFQPTEPPIPQAIQASEVLGNDHHGRCRDIADLRGGEASTRNPSVTLEGRISRAALQKAEIFGQVDQKFILAKVSADPSTNQNPGADNMLILIDQHAADERCQVEALLKSYFIPGPAGGSHFVAQNQSLDRPLRFDLSRQDGRLLVEYKTHFARWGIGYEVWQDQEEQEPGSYKTTVEVRTLPPSILERCRLEPRLLIELLRKEIWKLHGISSRRVGGTGTGVGSGGGEHDWVARFHECPEGIMEMIHSRACRSKSSLHHMKNSGLTLWLPRRHHVQRSVDEGAMLGSGPAAGGLRFSVSMCSRSTFDGAACSLGRQ